MYGLLLAAALGGATSAADRDAFTEDFADLGAWKTNSAATKAEVTAAGVGWTLPPVQPGIYFVERKLPIRVGPSHVLSFKVTCNEATAVEVQLVVRGAPTAAAEPAGAAASATVVGG